MPASLGRVLIVALALPLLPGAGAVHEGLHEQIMAVSRAIQEKESDARLYLQRAELRRLHRDWGRALMDFEHAARLEPGLAQLDLARGRLFLDMGRLESARSAVDSHLARSPDDPDARLLRATVLHREGRFSEAAQDYSRALATLVTVKPEHYLARAAALAGLEPDGTSRALRSLDEGVARLGPIAALELRAIELELALEQHDAALKRLGTIAAQSKRQERWLARRGDILAAAGRVAEAREAYRGCLAAIAALPARHRETGLARDLRVHALARLAEVDSPAKPAPKIPPHR